MNNKLNSLRASRALKRGLEKILKNRRCWRVQEDSQGSSKPCKVCRHISEALQSLVTLVPCNLSAFSRDRIVVIGSGGSRTPALEFASSDKHTNQAVLRPSSQSHFRSQKAGSHVWARGERLAGGADGASPRHHVVTRQAASAAAGAAAGVAVTSSTCLLVMFVTYCGLQLRCKRGPCCM